MALTMKWLGCSAIAAVLALALSSQGSKSQLQPRKLVDSSSSSTLDTCEPVLDTGSFETNCGGFQFSSEPCCGTSFFSDDESDGQCNVLVTSDSFCEANYPDVDCNSYTPTENDTFDLEVIFNYSTASCCQTCKCYGDPICQAFNGEVDQLIECDGRDPDTCKMTKDICLNQIDHSGNNCTWIKKTSSWVNFAQSGSPCQPDFELSGYNELTMVDTDDGFKVWLVTGERGVILNVSVQLPDYSEPFTLNSDACFDYSPRDVGTDEAWKAWTLPSTVDTIPSWWSASLPNDVEVLWTVGDKTTGFFVDLVCTQGESSERTRIDVERVMDYQFHEDGSGVCFDRVISKGSMSGSNVDISKSLHMKCLLSYLSDLTNTCRYLADDSCKAVSVPGWQEYWCESAELKGTQASETTDIYSEMVSQCIADITSGTEEEQSTAWATYACQMNYVYTTGVETYDSSSTEMSTYVTECLTSSVSVGENTWTTWANTYQGLIKHVWADDQSDSCYDSLSDFLDMPDDEECAKGVMLEYKLDDEWVPQFYFPPDKPICDNVLLSVNGSAYPELFINQLRWRQCGLSGECLIEKREQLGCSPVPAVTASILYENICGEDGICSCTTTNQDDSPEICEATDAAPYTLGSCDGCCGTNNFIVNHSSTECRDLTLETAYCNTADSSTSDYCDQLKKKKSGGTLTLDFTFPEDIITCCKNCTIWGDPYGEGFDGERDELIICDSRDTDTCKQDETRCELLLDHAGNNCTWNETVAEQIGNKWALIGVYGSPCQANYELSGVAKISAYSTSDPFDLSFSMGERSVLTEMFLQTKLGYFSLDPQKCFEERTNTNLYPGWNDTTVGDALTLSYIEGGDDGYGAYERVWNVYDGETGVFFRVVCIKMILEGGDPTLMGGYRFNLETLIEPRGHQNITGEGYCPSGDMDQYGQEYTRNNDGVICQNNLNPDQWACKAFWSKSCTLNEIEGGIMKWCEAANRPSGWSVEKCYNNIYRKSDSSLARAKRWLNAVCTALLPMKGSLSKKKFLSECKNVVSSDSDDSYYKIFETYHSVGDAYSMSFFQESSCASSVTKYNTRDKYDSCTMGVSVQYNPGSSDEDWVELFFIPETYRPCNNQLVINAWSSKYYPLFIYPVRFEQCDLDISSCPLFEDPEANCRPMYSFNVTMTYNHNNKIGCSSSS
mmetsp:Transcript_6861/g.12113  ORF Transcript_6861/g.12113 Transcript_6861/m.12113 type:complete len:1180 (+) Transcript_6861:171-3710(+)